VEKLRPHLRSAVRYYWLSRRSIKPDATRWLLRRYRPTTPEAAVGPAILEIPRLPPCEHILTSCLHLQGGVWVRGGQSS
jgi:hypothetical protein